jgi:imidazole glycerol-phosphate synthase subunit HisF
MLKKRLIACLLIKNDLIVQSIGFNKYLPIGNPKFPLEFLNKWDVDEIILLDIGAHKEKKKLNLKILEFLSKSCFVPLTVGGGITNVEDVRKFIRTGADKVSINSSAINDPKLITKIADNFGSQCVVVSIDCKLDKDGVYRVYRDSGKISTNRIASEWAKEIENLGAGEIFLNSIDRDGSKIGYDINLIKKITDAVSIPVIACGGVGDFSHFASGIIDGGASAVAAGNIFHYIEHSTIIAKMNLLQSDVDIRMDSEATYKGRQFDKTGRLMMMSKEDLSKIEFNRGKKDLI